MGYLQGGRLVQWMDITAAVTAQTHAEMICVTACISKVQFYHPALVGDIVTIRTVITRSFSTSMEILAEAYARKVGKKKNILLSKAFFNFVALDETTSPAHVPAVKPISEMERKEFRLALKRRKVSTRHQAVNA
jgi:acyl-CoA hydrolase